MTELLLLLALIVLNGIFAMSEIAVVSSRRARLVQMVDRGERGAALALELNAEPTRFLSTVQVGITSIGILSCAIGEGAIADRLRVMLEPLPLVGPYAGPVCLRKRSTFSCNRATTKVCPPRPSRNWWRTFWTLTSATSERF